ENGVGLTKCTVLGGRGFLGRALVDRLLRLRPWIVQVADSFPSPELKPSDTLLADALASGRASYTQVDVRQKFMIIEAVKGASVVFYIDCSETFPQDFLSLYNILVQGSRNVINACRECRVKCLIYNSSADVVFDDVHDIRNGDESLPYSGRFWNVVSDLRTQAEALILFANDVDGLLTCALRPCHVFGPGEQFLYMLVNLAKSYWAKFIIGSGQSCSDFTYVENVAHAHICAAECLNSQMVSVSGKAFFITNLEPVKFWEFVSSLLEGLGYQRPVICLPMWAVRWFCNLIKMLNIKSDSRKPDLGVFICELVALGSRTRTFNCSAAIKNIQYSPVVPMEEGVRLTVDSFSHLAVDSPLMRYKDSIERSKVEQLLGNGKVADILLWRDEKETFFSFLLLAFVYHWFFLSGQTFISSAARLLLLSVTLLCGHYFVVVTGFRIPRLPSSWFEISEVDMRNCFLTMKQMWNKMEHVVNALARGEDWPTFFKVSSFLYVCKLVIPAYLNAVLGLALILSFTWCFIYEQYEDKIDGIAGVMMGAILLVF
ncbi:hypothetical protein M569_02149, partial [Genlisea aurea]